MKKQTGSAAVSKNFAFKAPGGISPMMNIGGGTVSPAMYQPANAPLSKNAYVPSANAPVSKNFIEADRAAKAANKAQSSQTHSVMRKAW